MSVMLESDEGTHVLILAGFTKSGCKTLFDASKGILLPSNKISSGYIL